MLNAGDLDQRITLQQRSTGTDVLGQVSRTWVDVATVWAQAQPVRGREFFTESGAAARADVRFRIRYRADVTAEWRVQWRGQPYVLVAAPMDVLGKKTTLEMMCAAGLGDAQ